MAQLDAPSDWRPGGRGFNPRRGRQHSFVEIDHEIFSTVILSLPLIQEGQLSVSGERMCTILVNRLEDYACPVNVWLGKLTALDMTPLGWLGRKTSTQTNKTKESDVLSRRSLPAPIIYFVAETGVTVNKWRPGPEVIKRFSCSTQMSMKFVMLINLKLLTIANFFLLNITEHEHFSANKYENANLSWNFHIY